MTDYTAIPEKMRQAQRWLLWRYVFNPKKPDKPDKVPHYADGGKRGATDTPMDAARLVSFDEAQAALRAGTGQRWDGLGFALGPGGAGGHWQGVDYDNQPPERVAELLADSPGYVEASPGGEGVHLIGYGPHFKSLAQKDDNDTGVEAYASRRYFTVTGAQGRGEVEDLAEYVGTVVVPLAAAIRASKGNPLPAPDQGTSDDLDDALARDPLTAEQMAHLRDALGHLDADSYDVWIAMGQALCKKGEQGRELWMQWGATSAKFDEGEAAGKWGTFTGERTGIGAVFKAAEARGWVNPGRGSAGPAAPVARGFRFVPVGELLADRTPPRYLVHGLIEEGSLAMLFGAPSAGKSFLALDLAASVATGCAWCGRRVAQGAVFYLAGEGVGGIRRRLAAWGQHHGQALGDAPLSVSTGAVALDAKGAELVAVEIEALSLVHGTPRLVVVDTVARTMPGDESSNKDMSAFIAALDVLAARLGGVTILLIHHAGLSDADRARGASALRAALDVEFKLEQRAPGLRVLSQSKAKESDPIEALAFELRGVTLDGWQDDEGQPVASAVMASVELHRVAGPKFNGAEADILAAFADVADLGDGSASRAAVRDLYCKRHGGNPESAGRGFRRALTALLAQGHLREDAGELFTGRG